MSDTTARKLCPGCGARLIPYFGTLCSLCVSFPALLYPYKPIEKDARALRFDAKRDEDAIRDEDDVAVELRVEPFEPMSCDELRAFVSAMEQAERDERARFERHRARFREHSA